MPVNHITKTWVSSNFKILCTCSKMLDQCKFWDSLWENGRSKKNCLPVSVAEVGEQALREGRRTFSASKSLHQACTWGRAAGGPANLEQQNHSQFVCKQTRYPMWLTDRSEGRGFGPECVSAQLVKSTDVCFLHTYTAHPTDDITTDSLNLAEKAMASPVCSPATH